MLTMHSVYKQQPCNASFYIPFHDPGVHYCQKYASASHQVPANQKSIQLFCSETTQIVTNTVLKEGLIMGRNLLRHASLSLYNHFDTHETQHHDTIFNNSIDIRIV